MARGGRNSDSEGERESVPHTQGQLLEGIQLNAIRELLPNPLCPAVASTRPYLQGGYLQPPPQALLHRHHVTRWRPGSRTTLPSAFHSCPLTPPEAPVCASRPVRCGRSREPVGGNSCE